MSTTFGYRSNYATVIDVLRLFDPTLEASILDLDPNDEYIGRETFEVIQSELESAEAEVESDTNTAFRTVTYGQAGVYGSYHWIPKTDLINEESNNRPTRFYLRPNLIPFDTAKGDELAYRTGTDSFTPIPESQYMVNWRTGQVELFDVFGRSYFAKRVNRPYQSSPIVARYRYGAGGHRSRDAGETTIADAITSDDTNPTIGVADVERIPPNTNEPVLLAHSEYVRIDVDRSTSEVTITERGLRGTSDEFAHDSGATLHYCPMDIRKAVAWKTAENLNDWDFFVEWLTERVDYSDVQRRIDRAQDYYEKTVKKYRERDR